MTEQNIKYISDFSTSRIVDSSKPEEIIRQEYEKILYEDYFYDKKQMDIEVPIQIGSTKKRADIVIYRREDTQNRNQYKDIIGIVETKRKNRKDGIEQLTSYMQATSCIFGVWTNGDEIEYLYKNNNGEIIRDYIFNIPKNGETIESIGNITKEDLRPVKNLKPVFRRILNTLYSNTNISRKEKLGNEMIKLIFCKIVDEKYNITSVPEFRISIEESKNKQYDCVKKRIQKIFTTVKNELSKDDIFSIHDEITLDAKSISYVIGELEQISLLKTEKDVVGEAFETFAESKLVGEKGEFFTPREIVKLAIQILDPSPEQTIIDPACGSGGFLIYALEHIWRKMDSNRKYKNSEDIKTLKRQIAERCFYGIDKEIDLVRICKAYMTIIGDGKSCITQENTLHPIHEFNSKAKELFTTDIDGELVLKQFDFVITNPPFGSKIKVLKDDCKYFDLGHKWIENGETFVKTGIIKETEPQELFIERCLQLLKDGGKLAIVLPETYFHAPSKKYVLNYLIRNNNIIAIIDLSHNTFRPYCNAKTCLCILEKNRPQNNNIIMGIAEEIGHDHTGRALYRYNTSTDTFSKEICDDTKIIMDEIIDIDENSKNTFCVTKSDIVNDIYVPRYYWNKYTMKLIDEAKRLNVKFVSIQELIDKEIITSFHGHGSPPSEFKGKGEVPYIRVADIMNWEIYKNPTSMIPRYLYNSMIGNIELKECDILFVRRGSYRIGSVALISDLDTNVLLTNEITVIRVNDKKNMYHIDSYYLMFALSHYLTQRQLRNKIFIDTTLPNIGNRWRELLIPVFNDRKQVTEISNRVRNIFVRRWEAQKEILDIQNEFGTLTT